MTMKCDFNFKDSDGNPCLSIDGFAGGCAQCAYFKKVG